MKARRILDLITDLLMLLALAVAGVGHFLDWFRPLHLPESLSFSVVDFQLWHAQRSGMALGGTLLLVLISLAFHLGVRTRNGLALLMFLSIVVAIGFQMMIYTPYPITPAHRQFSQVELHEAAGFYLATIPTAIAGVLCLARMAWTMPASASSSEARRAGIEEKP